MKNNILLEEVRESAWFLLIGEKPAVGYAAAVGRSLQQPDTCPSVFRPSGISERTPLRRHPDSVPALPIALPPWAIPSCGVEDSVSSLGFG